mmetsp:Transcript_21326/g.46295  ORF Transcript_21326/g.46295 Transcript_21326/m.46295 type:complete len:889 (+) Transcript_21326:172-2838(+)
MARQKSSSKSVSSKSTISTAVSTTSFSSNGSSSNNSKTSKTSPSHKRGSVFGGIPRAELGNLGIPKALPFEKTIEDRSPTVSSKSTNDNMARVVDRTGAFPQMPPQANQSDQQQHQQQNNYHGGGGGSKSQQQFSSNNSVGSGSNGSVPPIPPSPRRGYSGGYNMPPQHPQIPSSPKLRAAAISSGASVGSNGGGLPRSNSYPNNGSGNTVGSNGSIGGGRNTPTGQNYHRRAATGGPTEDEKKQYPDYDDNATYTSHHTHGSNNSNGIYSQGGGRFVLSPNNSGIDSSGRERRGGGHSVSGGMSVASAGSGPRFATSVTGGSVSSRPLDVNLHDNVRQKGIAKRKRKEYSKDPKYTPVRRVVDELNKAIGVEKRRSAIERACTEFDHPNEQQHNAELYLGAANVLCLVLSMSEQEEEDRRICSALEMVYRAERDAVIISYQDVGAALVPLLLRKVAGYEKGRKVITAEVTIANISRILLHMTRISELRVPLVGHPGMLAALERVATLPLSMENRVLRMRLLANLANSEGNKVTIFNCSSLMEATMKVATLDKSENAREYASAVLMDLSSCPANHVAMARMDKVLATLVKLAVVEDKMETREYAVSALQNLAFEKQNRVQLVSYGSGVVIEALKKCTSSDSNDKTRRRSAGALTNLACDETAEKMANHSGLLQTLAQASVADKNKDVQQRATLALTKLANSITVKMSCWDTLLDALITASPCNVADGIVSAMFRVKTRSEENRTSMANHPRLLDTLAELCLRTKDIDNEKSAYKDCENATKSIAHLANDPLNHKLICNKSILAALVHGASLVGQTGVVTRDAAILAMERMAMEHANRPMMARFPGMLVTIAQATEREMNEELNGIPASSVTGQPRLAKPLLMSLLVAM